MSPTETVDLNYGWFERHHISPEDVGGVLTGQIPTVTFRQAESGDDYFVFKVSEDEAGNLRPVTERFKAFYQSIGIKVDYIESPDPSVLTKIYDRREIDRSA